MGRSRPETLTELDAGCPKSTYKVTFLPEGEVVEVQPDRVPYGRDGLPGSILDIALGADIPIDHACGGVVACSTCHVIVRGGEASFNESSEEEDDQLDLAPGLTPTSRLGCRAVPDGSCDVVVEIPEWNRNHTRESHH